MGQFDLVLASSSPRRRQLLEEAGLSFHVVVPDVDEAVLPNETPEAFAVRLATDKARAVADKMEVTVPVLAADTIVVLDHQILGKPNDASEAVAMLRSLSGKTHQVITAFCVLTADEIVQRVVRTGVAFRQLSDAEIIHYVQTGEPMDKAGAYGIQGGAAGMVESINGSYTNVVGLPVAEVLECLRTES